MYIAPMYARLNARNDCLDAQPQPLRSIRFSFEAVAICSMTSQHQINTHRPSQHTCVLVLCPRTGKFMACLLPLYVPISCNRRMLSLIRRRRSFSNVIVLSSAARSLICLSFSDAILAVSWMCIFAIICRQTCGPMP